MHLSFAHGGQPCFLQNKCHTFLRAPLTSAEAFCDFILEGNPCPKADHRNQDGVLPAPGHFSMNES
jgi:hypothetical protein